MTISRKVSIAASAVVPGSLWPLSLRRTGVARIGRPRRCNIYDRRPPPIRLSREDRPPPPSTLYFLGSRRTLVPDDSSAELRCVRVLNLCDLRTRFFRKFFILAGLVAYLFGRVEQGLKQKTIPRGWGTSTFIFMHAIYH